MAFFMRLGIGISDVISVIAPPLHSLHWKIFILCLVAIFVPGVFLAWSVGQSIERSHLRSTEEGMIDTALVVAETWSAASLTTLPTSREILRSVFKDFSPNLRIVLLDVHGHVLHDTANLWHQGSDMGAESDVKRAMAGNYGARWERDDYRRAVILHSTLPVMREGIPIGLVSVIKTTEDVRRSVFQSLQSLLLPAVLSALIASGVAYFLSTYLTRILKNLARQAEAVAAGDTRIRLETWSKSELGDLASAVELMRRKLEGKAFIVEMASTLSHEIKTPLAAIRGAAEILETTPDPIARQKFSSIIISETQRLAAIVSNRLALSRMESAPQEEAQASLPAIAHSLASVSRERAEMLGISFEATIAETGQTIAVPPDQLRHLLEALVENAIQFTPPGGKIELTTGDRWLRVRDGGIGIAPELHEKIFRRFFTTTNPLSGRRGTGLGLAIVASIAQRHNGHITLESSPGKGTTVTVFFDSAPTEDQFPLAPILGV